MACGGNGMISRTDGGGGVDIMARAGRGTYGLLVERRPGVTTVGGALLLRSTDEAMRILTSTSDAAAAGRERVARTVSTFDVDTACDHYLYPRRATAHSPTKA